MNEHRSTEMAEATRLTRAGRLAEATALIQRTLGKSAAGRTPPDNTRPRPSTASTSWGRPALKSRPAARPGTPFGKRIGLDYRKRGAAKAAAVTPAPGAQFLDLSFGNEAGRRAYKLYVPSGYSGRAVPLLVMLHGGTQNAVDFAAGTRMNELAESHTFLVAYPEQDRSANAMRFWNWFQPANQQRGSGEPSILAGITEQVAATYAVDGDRVYIAGFSAGGAMTAVMAATYPDLYAAAGVYSGLPYAVAHDVQSAFAAMKQGGRAAVAPDGPPLPLIVFHGDRDTTVDVVNARLLVDDGRTGRPTTTSGHAPGSYGYTREVYDGSDGRAPAERWTVHGLGHAWVGGSPNGSYTDPQGPDASAELVRFLLQHQRRGPKAGA